MILEAKTETLVLEDGDAQESVQMEIDKDSHIFLMRMLSKFYSDGIGSLIRETCSNALDSHRACNSEQPIIVSFITNNNGNYEFSVEDFGCGIDDQDVENIIKKYGKSTKRQSENQLGAFGLGFKSPLAYTSSFYFIGRKGGIERKWMLYESDDETNKIDLLYEAPTTEANGVKVIVPVKYHDRSEFIRKIKEQLAYFEHVYFNCPNEINNSNVKIYRHEEFQWSSLVSNSQMHICLDNVYYPIDWSKLGINSIYIPIGLRFSLKDGLFPIPNREQLKYTPEAKAIILEKIKTVATYFVEKYNESIRTDLNIFEILNHYRTSNRYIPHFDGYNKLDVRDLEYYSPIKFINPTLPTLKLLPMSRVNAIKEYLLSEYTIRYTLQNGRFNSTKNRGYRDVINFHHIWEKRTIYTFSELSMQKRNYLRDLLGNRTAYFVKKDKPHKLGSVAYRYTGRGYDNYVNILELWNFPKHQWRDIIKEAQHVTSLLTSNFIDVDSIEIPAEWIEGRKKKRLQTMQAKGTNVRKKKLSGEVIAKQAAPLERYVSGKNCKFISTTIQMDEAYKQPFFTIYGGTNDENKIKDLYEIFDRKKTRFLLFSDRELKNLKDINLHNWMEINKFMEGNHIIFKRVVTAYLIHTLYDKYPNVFYRKHELEKICPYLAENLTILYDYQNEHYISGNNIVFKAMLEVARDKNLFDLSVYGIYKEVKDTFEKLPFLNITFRHLSSYDNQKMLNVIRDLFKYYKQRLDWHQYLPVIEKKEEKQEEVELI